MEEEAQKSKDRGDYFRCRVCKTLWEDKECILDPIKGFICPNQCQEPFKQEEYELPTQE